MNNQISDLDQQYLDHWMKLLERENVSAHFMETFVAMHRRLAAYMAKDRALIATMASNIDVSPRTAVARAREILGHVDRDVR